MTAFTKGVGTGGGARSAPQLLGAVCYPLCQCDSDELAYLQVEVTSIRLFLLIVSN